MVGTDSGFIGALVFGQLQIEYAEVGIGDVAGGGLPLIQALLS